MKIPMDALYFIDEKILSARTEPFKSSESSFKPYPYHHFPEKNRRKFFDEIFRYFLRENNGRKRASVL